jgi:hypothetical protein
MEERHTLFGWRISVDESTVLVVMQVRCLHFYFGELASDSCLHITGHCLLHFISPAGFPDVLMYERCHICYHDYASRQSLLGWCDDSLY